MIPEIYKDINLDPDNLVVSEDTNITSDGDVELPLLKEYAFDFEKQSLIYDKGLPVILEGLEALKVQNKKALLTKRFRYLGYSWNYGCELEDLLGKAMSEKKFHSECRRYLEECLLVNPYNLAINEVTVNREDGKFKVEVLVNTVYGEVVIDGEII